MMFILGFSCISKITSGTSIFIFFIGDSLGSHCPNPPWSDAFNMKAEVTGYNVNDTFTVKVFFGDGTFASSNLWNTYINPSGMQILESWGDVGHTYFNTGHYDVTYIVTGPDGNADTLFVPSSVIIDTSCGSISSSIYVDENSNCVHDSNETNISYPIYIMNGPQRLYLISGGFANNMNYSLVLDSSIVSSGYIPTCPISAIHNFTLNGSYFYEFGVQCDSSFDFLANSSGYGFKPFNSPMIWTSVHNISCLSSSGSYIIELDPRMQFVGAFTSPDVVAGNTLTWNFSNLKYQFPPYYGYSYPSSPYENYFYVNLDPSVQLGDTLCYTMRVTPTIGDRDSLNNTITRCYVVKSSWDPNFKEVVPTGNGVTGNVLPGTEFTYTIHFQNTGNDTAARVYIIDTLDSDLDINSINILSTSHNLNFSILDGNVLKFDFPYIMLPDSGTNEPKSHGYVSYKSRPLSSSPNGTVIENRSHIYFDHNSPVMTNTTINTIDISLGTQSIKSKNLWCTLFTNAITEKLEINMKEELPARATIFDVTGKKVTEILLQGKKSEIDISRLSKGVYILHLDNNENSASFKFIK